MTLLDARRLAVRQQVRIGFSLANGMECVVNEHGLSAVPALAGPPDFNLEEEFSRAPRFTIEAGGQARTVSREELETMTRDKAVAAGQQEE